MLKALHCYLLPLGEFEFELFLMIVMTVMMMVVFFNDDGEYQRNQFVLLEELLQFVFVDVFVDVLVYVLLVETGFGSRDTGQTEDEKDERSEHKGRLDE